MDFIMRHKSTTQTERKILLECDKTYVVVHDGRLRINTRIK